MKDFFKLPVLAGASLLVSLSVAISSLFGGGGAKTNPNEQALALPVYVVNQGGTGASSFTKYPIVGAGTTGALTSSTTIWVVGVNATGTTDTIASTFVRSRTTFGTTTNATSTNFFATTASTTNLYGSGLTSCNGTSFLQWSAGLFGCGSPSASAAYPFTTLTNYSVTVSATNTPIWAQAGIQASSTSYFVNTVATNGTTTNATSTTFSVANITATGSTTLQNFTGVNSTTTNATSTNFFATTASSTNLYAGTLGVASTTPFYALSIGQGNGSSTSSILCAEDAPATSTSMTVSFKNGCTTHIRIGTAAITITFSNVAPGATHKVIIENPGSGTAGTITWGSVVFWTGGTIPSQTTTANKMDVWSFLSTQSSTTPSILGAQTPNF